MNELHKAGLRRALGRIGLRVQRASMQRFFQEGENYPEIAADGAGAVILDVGANVGQTSIWFRKSFPKAEIHSFEPFPAVFERLRENTRSANVHSHRMALGDVQGERQAAQLSADPECQINRVDQVEDAGAGTVRFPMETVDAFCTDRKIARVDILKTDTEGCDLAVLRGAREMLQRGAISNVVCEASMHPEDQDHTNFFELLEVLASHDLYVHSLYDIVHGTHGRLFYFNALFKRRASMDKSQT